tara:strand:- start:2949 stop:3359 length:411 start_codon:yes stop_codon:yes gene_type:complete
MDKLNIISKKIPIIKNINGNILKGIDKNSDYFKGFGELYFSFIKENSIKAWKKHDNITSIFFVPIGNVKFVLYSNSKFKSYIIGENNHRLLRIKPKTWYGFKGMSQNNNLVVSLINKVHNDKEMQRKKLNFLKYSW